MGTNYYLVEKNTERDEEDDIAKMLEPSHILLHIGKSSAGWCFSLHVYPERGINNIQDWKNFLKEQSLDNEDFAIINEYYEYMSITSLFDIIENRRSDQSWEDFDEKLRDPNTIFYNYHSLNEFLDKNTAIKGPNNLLRHRISNHCIGHGEGTYDYIIGEFS